MASGDHAAFQLPFTECLTRSLTALLPTACVVTPFQRLPAAAASPGSARPATPCASMQNPSLHTHGVVRFSKALPALSASPLKTCKPKIFAPPISNWTSS